MPEEKQVRNRAADQKIGMTLADLTRFVQDCWLRDLDPDAHIRVISAMSGKIRQITAFEVTK